MHSSGRRFNAARGFVGGAASMIITKSEPTSSFNAARGFVGGATTSDTIAMYPASCFNAARGFVGGATASLAALVPLWGKSPFGKSPEI